MYTKMDSKRLESLLETLRQLGLLTEYKRFVPDPLYLRGIITLANEDRNTEALMILEKTEQMLHEVEKSLNEDDYIWYVDLIAEIKSSLP